MVNRPSSCSLFEQTVYWIHWSNCETQLFESEQFCPKVPLSIVLVSCWGYPSNSLLARWQKPICHTEKLFQTANCRCNGSGAVSFCHHGCVVGTIMEPHMCSARFTPRFTLFVLYLSNFLFYWTRGHSGVIVLKTYSSLFHIMTTVSTEAPSISARKSPRAFRNPSYIIIIQGRTISVHLPPLQCEIQPKLY